MPAANETPNTYSKQAGIEYFNVMNPEKYYPMLITLTNYLQPIIAPEENIFTGERKIQKLETMAITVKNPIVTVRPVFPGCNVTPSEIDTDLRKEKDELTFYITPLVKDDIKGRVEIVSERQIIYTLKTPCKVDDPRIAKAVAAYGVLASIVPKILTFLGFSSIANIPINLGALTTLMGGTTQLTDIIALLGTIVMFIVSLFIYKTKQPKSTKRQIRLTDFRADIMSEK